ncbi:MAG TPA: Uma2 family endonuclease [Blastocatellia bacterium]|nr:Uma2 family endonuclease [Blastocatellia bacterium]
MRPAKGDPPKGSPKGLIPLCPDFLIELRSPTDAIGNLQSKMQEYIDNGAELGWLIDPLERKVYIYSRSAAPVCLDNPAEVSAEPELCGFELNLYRIWDR